MPRTDMNIRVLSQQQPSRAHNEDTAMAAGNHQAIWMLDDESRIDCRSLCMSIQTTA